MNVNISSTTLSVPRVINRNPHGLANSSFGMNKTVIKIIETTKTRIKVYEILKTRKMRIYAQNQNVVKHWKWMRLLFPPPKNLRGERVKCSDTYQIKKRLQTPTNYLLNEPFHMIMVIDFVWLQTWINLCKRRRRRRSGEKKIRGKLNVFYYFKFTTKI